MHFLLRVHCCQYCQLSVLHRALYQTRPDQVRRLRYRTKQGYVIYRIHLAPSVCCWGEVDATVGLWEFWIPTRLVKIPHTDSLRLLSSWVHPIKLSAGALIASGAPHPSTSTERCMADICRPKDLWPGKGPKFSHTALDTQSGEGAFLSSSTIRIANTCDVYKLHTHEQSVTVENRKDKNHVLHLSVWNLERLEYQLDFLLRCTWVTTSNTTL